VKIKTFKVWEGYYDPPEQEESYLERFEELFMELEEKLRKEGINIPEDYWDLLEILDKEWDFDGEVDEMINKFWENDYEDGYNKEYGGPTLLKNYLEIKKEAQKEAEKTFPSISNLPGPSGTIANQESLFTRKRESFVDKYMMKKLIESNWSAFRIFYKKWADYLHNNRGRLGAKKYKI
jgi:hypothetical protein